METILNVFIDWYRAPQFPYVVAGWLLAAFLTIAIVWIVRSVAFWFATHRRIQAVQNALGTSTRISDLRSNFKVNIKSIHETMRGRSLPSPFSVIFAGIDRSLERAWIEFCESFVTTNDANESVIRNTQRPIEYFRAAAFPPRTLGLFANVFVGVGLLFTFLGLVAALRFATEGLVAGDAAQMMDVLQAILYAAAAKFSSIAFARRSAAARR